VDFGASDGPMTDQQIQQVRGNVLHVPTVLGAVVLTYHLPELGTHRLRLDGPAIADIFLGKVTAWNDRRLAALNPGVNLPARDLIVVHRSDGSGTTYIFTDYLSKISPEWASGVGRSTAVNWPVGLGGKGNEGVTQQVKQSDGALGYVELIYAVSNSLPYAQVRNAAGTFVDPSVESVSAAAASVSLPPETDFRVSITNPPGAGAYPISSFTWLLVRRTSPDSTKARLLEGFLTWMLGPEPQKMAAELNYAPLPAALVKLVRARIDGGGSVTRPLQARDRSRESSL
jgi:phosphate transport system substrate-binding protein